MDPVADLCAFSHMKMVISVTCIGIIISLSLSAFCCVAVLDQFCSHVTAGISATMGMARARSCAGVAPRCIPTSSWAGCTGAQQQDAVAETERSGAGADAAP